MSMDILNLELLSIKKEVVESGEYIQYSKEYLEKKLFSELLSLVRKEIPECKIIVGKDSIFFVLEDNLEYLDDHIDFEIDRLQAELFDMLCLRENCQWNIKRFHDKQYEAGYMFDFRNGELVRGNKEAFEKLQENEG